MSTPFPVTSSGAVNSNRVNHKPPAIYDPGGSLIFDDKKIQLLKTVLKQSGSKTTWSFGGWFRPRTGIETSLFMPYAPINIGVFEGIFYVEDYLYLCMASTDASTYQYYVRTVDVFRDSSSFYHVHFVLDTTNDVEADRLRIYVNGKRQAVTVYGGHPPKGAHSHRTNNSAYTQYLGGGDGTGRTTGWRPMGGELCDPYFVDDQALEPTIAGHMDEHGTWRIKKPDMSSWTGNSFFLNFEKKGDDSGSTIVEWQSRYGYHNIKERIIDCNGVKADLVFMKPTNSAQATSMVVGDSKRANGDVSRLGHNTADERSYSKASMTVDGRDFFTVDEGYDFRQTDGNICNWQAFVFEANKEYGVEVLDYIGTGVKGEVSGHGLERDIVMAMVINNSSTVTMNYVLYAKDACTDDKQYISLSSIDARLTAANDVWDIANINDTIFSVGTSGLTNKKGDSYTVYAFSEVPGYSYYDVLLTNTTWQTITCGFKPRILFWRRYGNISGTGWIDMDTLKTITTNGLTGNAFDMSNYVNNVTDTGFDLKDDAPRSTIVMAFADMREFSKMLMSEIGDIRFSPVNFDNRTMFTESTPENVGLILEDRSRTYGGHGIDYNAAIIDDGCVLAHSGSTSNNLDTRVTLTKPLPRIGKWYWEVDCCFFTGIAEGTKDSDGEQIRIYDGYPVDQMYIVEKGVAQSDGITHGRRHISVLADMDNNILRFECNDGYMATVKIPDWDNVYVILQAGRSGVNYAHIGSINVGQRPFRNEVPQGYLPLKDITRLPPKISNPGKYFKAVVYDGNTDIQDILVGFDADVVWIKCLTSAASHRLYNRKRGDGKVIFPDSYGPEVDEKVSGNRVFTFIDGGFRVFSNSAGGVYLNLAGQKYVALCWKEGEEAGFETVQYKGDGSGDKFIPNKCHGLYDISFRKGLNISTANWFVTQKYLPGYTHLDGLYKLAAGAGGSGLVEHDSDGFIVSSNGTSSGTVYSNGNQVTYDSLMWRSVEGLSKIGIYIGSGNARGPFVLTDFKPALVIYKSIPAAYEWHIAVNTEGLTEREGELHAHDSRAFFSLGYPAIEFAANGFRVLDTGNRYNVVNRQYIYMAFAENPFSNTNAR